MSNLNEVMKGFGYHNINDIPERLKTEFENRFSGSTYRDKDLENKKALLIPLKNFDAGVYVFERNQYKYNSNEVEYTYLEDWLTVAVMGKNYPCVMGSVKEKSFFYILNDINRTCSLKYDTLKTYIKLSEPNRIGVFTDKKIQEWLNYCDEYQQAREVLRNEAATTLKANYSEVEKIAELLGTKLQKHETTIYLSNKDWYIKATTNKENGHIYWDIDFRGGVTGLIKLLELQKQ